jgi:hypothetical protein
MVRSSGAKKRAQNSIILEFCAGLEAVVLMQSVVSLGANAAGGRPGGIFPSPALAKVVPSI